MNKLFPLSVGIVLFSFQNHEKKTDASRVSEIAKPNILFLFADDQRADALGCSGNTYIRTPHIDIYPERTIPLPGNFNALHPFAFDNLNIRDETLAPWPRTPEVIQGKERTVRSSLYTAYRNTVRAVRTDEWKLIRYPQRNYTQLFNL